MRVGILDHRTTVLPGRWFNLCFQPIEHVRSLPYTGPRRRPRPVPLLLGLGAQGVREVRVLLLVSTHYPCSRASSLGGDQSRASEEERYTVLI